MSTANKTTNKQSELPTESEAFTDLPEEKPFELPPGNAEEAIALLRLWREDESDEEEQRETWDYLKRVLDEDRLSDRKLFS